MSKLLFQFRHSGGHPTLEEVQRRFGFTESETDREYGVVEVDEEEGLYTVLVDEAVRTRMPAASSGNRAEGFFSNPRIEPFGPPER